MPINERGDIIPKTPTEQLLLCLEEIGKDELTKSVVVIFGREREREDGVKGYTVRTFGSADLFSTLGLLDLARQDTLT